MKMVIAGVIATVAVALFAWFVVYPFVFNGVQGLFETSDLGTVIALAACVLVTIPLFWLGVSIVAAVVFLTAWVQDEADRRSDLRRNRRIREGRQR